MRVHYFDQRVRRIPSVLVLVQFLRVAANHFVGWTIVFRAVLRHKNKTIDIHHCCWYWLLKKAQFYEARISKQTIIIGFLKNALAKYLLFFIKSSNITACFLSKFSIRPRVYTNTSLLSFCIFLTNSRDTDFCVRLKKKKVFF